MNAITSRAEDQVAIQQTTSDYDTAGEMTLSAQSSMSDLPAEA